MRKKQAYFISAGEQSGDQLASDLVLSLEPLTKLQPFGITGDTMTRAGVHSIATTDDLSIMGLTEVLKHIGSLCLLERRILSEIDRRQPKFAVLVDFPGFHMRLAEQIKMRGIPVIQFVAPKIWAWGSHRAEKIRQCTDLVMGILPFEEEFFRQRGVNYSYVGFPAVSRIEKVQIERSVFGIADYESVIAFLPGSRKAEIKRILPTMFALKNMIRSRVKPIKILSPIAKSLDWHWFYHFAKRFGSIKEADDNVLEIDGIRFYHGSSLEIMKCADVALVTSGTATLECALAKTPQVVIYNTDPLTFAIAQKVIQIPYISLVNLILREPLVKEFIQDYSLSEVAEKIVALLEDPNLRNEMISKYEKLPDMLRPAEHDLAAKVLLKSFMPSLRHLSVG